MHIAKSVMPVAESVLHITKSVMPFRISVMRTAAAVLVEGMRLTEFHAGRLVRGMFPVGAEVLPEVSQQILADRLVTGGGFQELFPESAELIVRDRGEGGVGQRPPADARGLVEVPGFRMVPVEIEEVQKGVLVELVLDVTVHDLLQEPLRLLLESQSIQQASSGERGANLRPALESGGQ
jgi:hypothetical protein